MESRLEQYRALAVTCSATDYRSLASVRRHNVAADAMRWLTAMPGAAVELLPLLAEPEAGKWLAFQLLDAGGLPDDVAQRCLTVIKALAAGSDGEALGARMWLREKGHS